jgi:hypothetical protein
VCSSDLIESFVVFSKVDPGSLDQNTAKGKALLNFIYEKAKPIEPQQPSSSSVAPAVKPAQEAGIKPVATTSTTNRAAEQAAAARQAQFENTLAQLQTTMSQLVLHMDAIRGVLTNPRGIPVQK